MELHSNWNFYEETMRKVNEENVHFAKVKASSEDELIQKFKVVAREWDHAQLLDDIEEGEVPIHFIGAGYYDLWGYDFGVGQISRIDEILKGEVEEIEIFTNPDKVKKEIKQEEGSRFIYAVYGVIHTKFPNEFHLKYIVTSDNPLTDSEVYEVLKRNGIPPYAYGLSVQTSDFANFTIESLDDMDSEDLFRFVYQKNDSDREVETYLGEF